MKDWSILLKETLESFYNRNRIEHFKSLSSNYQRVECLLEEERIVNVIDSYLNEIESIEGKSVESSAKHRKQGNEYYCKKDYKTALKYYTLALINAPKSSESLLLSYSNRSAVFFGLKHFEQCLCDLNRAKRLVLDDKETKSKERLSLVLKLLTREVNCLLELNRPLDIDQDEFVRLVKERFIDSKDEIEAKISSLKSMFEDNRNKQKKQINDESENDGDKNKHKHKTHEGVNFISESIDVVYDENKGRHCRANRLIKAGECLFVEKAYCAIVLPEFALDYCPSCFRRTYDEANKNFVVDLNLEPCDKCTSIVYCSEACKKEESENGAHKYECGVLAQLLHNLGIAHLAYRIVASTPLDVLNRFVQYEIDKSTEIGVDLMKIDYKNSRDDNDYEQVFHLMTHENETHVDDLFKYTLTAVLLGKIFLMKSDFEKTANLSNLKMLSCLILRHILQSICNAHAMTQLHDKTPTDEDQRETFDREQIRFATAIYPRVSLLNHSCNSNVISSFKPNSRTIVVKAARDIQISDEVFNCYGPHYLKMGLIERQQSLLEQYRFKCDCEECIRQLNGLKSQSKSSLRCLKCKSNELIVDFADSIQLKCTSCNNFKFTYDDYISLFDKLNYHLSQIDTNTPNLEMNLKQIVHLNRVIEEYRGYLLLNEKLEIIDAKTVINDTFRLFYVDFSKAIDLLARLYCNLREFKRASELVESNIRLLERIYTSSQEPQKQAFNIELANELFKLAEIQCNCQKWSKALDSVNRSIRIAENLYSKDNNLILEFYELKKNILSILSS